nr:PREDICTED: uncharacterized protein LOC105662933 [Megachile rotundata]
MGLIFFASTLFLCLCAAGLPLPQGGGGAGVHGQPQGPVRRGRGWRDWRRGDPMLIKGLWKSKGPLDSLGNAEAYIFLALLIGAVTVVVGCWLSDNCWSPEPEGVVTVA